MTAEEYYCPGEKWPISRAVHLARLAAFDVACRTCPRRFETGPTSILSLEDLEQLQARAIRASWVSETGIRGLFLNEIDRSVAIRWGDALGRLLPHRQRSPVRELKLVVAYDERPSSPEIVQSLGLGLRRQGCQVIDLGPVTGPCFRFAVQSLGANAGVYVTGGTAGPAWTGFDLVDEHAVPWSAATGLLEWEALSREEADASTAAQAGRLTTDSVQQAYEDHLSTAFHGLRPLQLVIGTTTAAQADLLRRLFASRPCHCHQIALPNRERAIDQPSHPDVVALRQEILTHRADAGILLTDDGQQFAVLDEAGRLRASADVGRLLAAEYLRQFPERHVLMPRVWWEELPPFQKHPHMRAAEAPPAELPHELLAQSAGLALGEDGRHFQDVEGLLIGDSLRTLGLFLQALSRSDTPLSELLS